MVGELDDGLEEGGGEAEVFRNETTLRSMIAYGRLEPKYGMRLWIQIMRTLARHHSEQVFFGCLTPEAVRIDMQNQVELDAPSHRPEIYTAPEVLAGQAPGPHSDVYAMGVILFEMVTGSLEHFSTRSPAEIKADIPSWLNELIMKCTSADREDRFASTEEVSEYLVKIKDSV